MTLRTGLLPEHPEGPPCQVRVLYERHILCATEGYAAFVPKRCQRLFDWQLGVSVHKHCCKVDARAGPSRKGSSGGQAQQEGLRFPHDP